ncbi:actin patch protein [Drechmeria coniospora]|uniref:Actin patch protein n=1 Tax=Drechmeria coniospora TaxID=98403 RepID=A0A151GH41_DRECN|nr:actin patch protein [Drechmeria coniospora]KYK56423.1 actin patch protein [Drechmeria coniospora]
MLGGLAMDNSLQSMPIHHHPPKVEYITKLDNDAPFPRRHRHPGSLPLPQTLRSPFHTSPYGHTCSPSALLASGSAPPGPRGPSFRRVQSAVHGFLSGRQRRRAERARLVDLVASRPGRLMLDPPSPLPRLADEDARGDRGGQHSMRVPARDGNDGSPQDDGEKVEKGSRRRRLAAMAGSLYRSGQLAVTDIKDSYAQSRARAALDPMQESTHIPGAFPDVAITSQGDEQMILFPSYAKRHVPKDWARVPAAAQQSTPADDDYWRQEWEKNEDSKAIVDVDVRGWIYSPSTGPLTKRNRILLGLARQLSGIPSSSRPDQAYATDDRHQGRDELREQERITQEAAAIERRGREEKRIAYGGGYSEPSPGTAGPGVELVPPRPAQRASRTPDSMPGSPMRQPSQANELSEQELAAANANLMARVAPFMTNPLVALPITIFFYNNAKSQSRTVLTNDAGHFMVRAPLDFVPTNVRVLANERLSATQEIHVTEPRGVSLITDIDDTIKHSNISGGAREIFRNTFVRDLDGLTVDGVREWYGRMHELGVCFHYCSNSPWQLFPVLASFFKLGRLPPGSLHLKQYSGMLQGIFEPVAERKKSTLNRLMTDFAERRFILVGDSGEADLEVYTDLVLANPGRILAVFIRDVTTPETTGYFDSSFALRQKTSSLTLAGDGSGATRQNSAPAVSSTGPLMGTLIDLSAEPEEAKLDDSAALEQVKRRNQHPGIRSSASAGHLGGTKAAPPPRPTKPVALRSRGSNAEMTKSVGSGPSAPPPPPPRRKPVGGGGLLHPHSQAPSPSKQTRKAEADDRPPPPLPRRPAEQAHRSASPRGYPNDRGPTSKTNSDVELDGPSPAPFPGRIDHRTTSKSGVSSPSSAGSPTLGPQVVNKKLELWRGRLARAEEILDKQGVALYTWRKGQDVEAEAVGIVRRAMEEMERDEKQGRQGS